MAKEAAQRYENVAAFYQALVAATRSIVDVAKEPSSPLATPSAVTALPSLPLQATLIAPPAAPPDGGLAELPSEATALSAVGNPTQPNPQVPIPTTGETQMPLEQTRITRTPEEPSDGTARPRAELATGRMAAIRQNVTSRISRAGGIAIGVFVGVVLAVAVGLFWR
jgi:hypothetical protein